MSIGIGEMPRHGGDLGWARLRYPAAPEPWIDLSTGVNPVSYPLPALDPDLWSRLPSGRHEERLIVAAAKRYGVTKDAAIVAAPGTQAVIQVLPRLVEPSRVAILGPTYEEHVVCWRRHSHDVVLVDDVDDAAQTAARIVVLVNPDNPTGRVVPPGPLRDLATRLAPGCGLLVVDEAFMDVLEPGLSLASDLPRATVVLRSFGKIYGLAGLRLGFAIAERTMAHRLRAMLGPWSVSGPALAIGTTALTDRAWLERAIARLNDGQARLDGILRGAGFSILGGTPLFRLAEHTEASLVADRLGRRGIFVRSFDRQTKWLRFGQPGSEGAWQRLETALRNVQC